MTGVLKGIGCSFYSGRFYHDLARNSRGIGFPYIVFLSLLTVVSLMLGAVTSGFYAELQHGMETAPDWVKTLPAMNITNHRLSIDKPSPYRLQLGSDKNTVAIIIDTNDQKLDLDALETRMQQEKIPVFITAEQMIIYKEHEHKLEIIDFKSQPDNTLTHESWARFGEHLREWGTLEATLATLFILFPILLLGGLIIVFFNALAVLLLGVILQAELDLAASMRLAAAYAIPVHILPEIMKFAGVSVVLSGWVLWLLYLIFSVWESKPGTQTVA